MGIQHVYRVLLHAGCGEPGKRAPAEKSETFHRGKSRPAFRPRGFQRPRWPQSLRCCGFPAWSDYCLAWSSPVFRPKTYQHGEAFGYHAVPRRQPCRRSACPNRALTVVPLPCRGLHWFNPRSSPANSSAPPKTPNRVCIRRPFGSKRAKLVLS